MPATSFLDNRAVDPRRRARLSAEWNCHLSSRANLTGIGWIFDGVAHLWRRTSRPESPSALAMGSARERGISRSQKPDVAHAMSRKSRVPAAAGPPGEIDADPVNVIKTVIQRLIPRGGSGIGSAAMTVGMSVRTLQRRLADMGVSYSDLVDEVRLASALTLIDDRSIKLSEIARRLGYADAANFDRAFKRWTGLSPSQARAFDRKSRIDLAKMRTSGSVPPRRSDRM